MGLHGANSVYEMDPLVVGLRRIELAASNLFPQNEKCFFIAVVPIKMKNITAKWTMKAKFISFVQKLKFSNYLVVCGDSEFR